MLIIKFFLSIINKKTQSLCHLANISYRVGNITLKYNGAAEKFANDIKADKYLKTGCWKP
jgi:hypothetical protein